LAASLAGATAADHPPKPNLVVIFADDLGYGDLACFGHPTVRTPHLDRMAQEGQRWTSFYVAASVCTPSRAALLTGRYPVRSGMCSDRRRVLFPDSKGGLPAGEVTVAEALAAAGYATAAVGKWHLGHLPEFLPTAHGFGSYFGIPYSNDMDKRPDTPGHVANAEAEDFAPYNVPLMRGSEVVERPADQRTITRRYTEEAVRFIESCGDRPFFLYLAHNLPHVPLFRSPEFRDTSRRGIYGDVVEEIDWSVGQVRAALERTGATGRTLVLFTSDNGPWLPFKSHGGSASLLRDGKGSTWEGGMRVPAVFWGPGIVKPDTVRDPGSTLDVLPTALALAGVPPPGGRTLDGADLTPALTGTGPSPRREMFFYHGKKLFAVRHGRYKAHFLTKTSYTGQNEPETHDPPLLYDLEVDPSERHDVAGNHPDVLAKIQTLAANHTASVEAVENQLERR
jgi:arylsulfatase A-like enzyme